MPRESLSHCRAAVTLLLIWPVLAQMPARADQARFRTPEDAVQALKDAAGAKDQAALATIFGPDRAKLLTGDAVEDNNALERFSQRMAESFKLEKVNAAKVTLLVGAENWPTPIPIVKEQNQWRFDTAAGLEEILNRHIGDNELSAIMTCRAYVLAQWEYYTQATGTAQDGLAVYAQKFISSAGKRDGLYWDTPADGKPSPLGRLVAQARAEGYAAGQPRPKGSPQRPYHGYYFKILTRQGPHAPGGKFSYVINGNMIAGYALLAYPDKWGGSGIMTFIVNQQGRVYERNFGAKTTQIAAGITEYDPDSGWTLVKQ
ncbi:MAG TPA: DUF2950 domain-containing protein [Bryobacteraceae bacterium]|nr:DUF2950 domain-containing protein [Bryobacteraceae bacterium]